MENLKKRLLTQDIEVRIKIGCEMQNVQNKLKKSNYSSVGQFLNEIKAIWRGLLNSHKKEDPIYQTSLMMEEYSKQLINTILRKRGEKS